MVEQRFIVYASHFGMYAKALWLHYNMFPAYQM